MSPDTLNWQISANRKAIIIIIIIIIIISAIDMQQGHNQSFVIKK